MKMNITLRPYQESDQEQVIRLWQRCGLVVAWNNPKRDIERKLKVNPDLFLIAEQGGEVVATCMAGYEGHRGWINYLAVSPEYRRRGIAREIMAEAERRLKAAGCPKINLQIRGRNKEVIAFYRSIGYKMDDVLSMGKRLEEDRPYPTA
jgi:ribosomal protein S18 acetylase RimI-like enzyme